MPDLFAGATIEVRLPTRPSVQVEQPTAPSTSVYASPAVQWRAEVEALRARVRPPTVALLGDSITWYNGAGEGVYDTPVAVPYHNSQGYFTWANASLGGRLTLVRNAGVAGQSTDEMLARITDITDLPVAPGYCIVLGGTNDVLDDRTTAPVIADLQAIYDALHAKGIAVVACTMPPVWSDIPSRLLAQAEVNNWIRSRATLPGFIVCDWAARWADAAVGGARTGYTVDGVHPSPLGAGALGKVLADALRPYIGGSVLMPAQNPDPTNALTNGMLLGASGAKGSGVSGSLADSWICGRSAGAGTLTLAKVARTDGIAGEWQSLTLAGGGGTFVMYQDASPAGIAAGQRWIGEAEYDSLTPTDVRKFNLTVAAIGGGGGGYALNEAAGSSLPYPADVPAGIISTPEFTVTGAVTGLQTIVHLTGSAGSVRVARIRVRRVS